MTWRAQFISPYRSLLRGVVSEVFMLALCLPFPAALVPVDAFELRSAPCALCGFQDNAVLDVVVVRPRRSLLRSVVSQVFLRGMASVACLPFPAVRGSHSSTLQLNVCALCGIGGAFRGCLGGF